MSNTPHSYTRILTTLIVTCVVAAFTAQPVAAQTAKKLKCNGCVKSKQLKNNGIRGKDIKNGSLTALDLGDEAGVDFVDGDPIPELVANVDTVIVSLTVTAPSSGFVILNASGTFDFDVDSRVRCSLTTVSSVEGNDSQDALSNVGGSMIFGLTEGFAVLPGSTTFNLVCEKLLGRVFVRESDLTAIYAPTRY